MSQSGKPEGRFCGIEAHDVRSGHWGRARISTDTVPLKHTQKHRSATEIGPAVVLTLRSRTGKAPIYSKEPQAKGWGLAFIGASKLFASLSQSEALACMEVTR